VEDKARRDGWGSGEVVQRRASRRRARDGLESELGDGEVEGLDCPFIERGRGGERSSEREEGAVEVFKAIHAVVFIGEQRGGRK
jgi:hypothetical protein